MEQKTLTDLFGPPTDNDMVMNRDIVRRVEGNRFRNLWRFDSHAMAIQCFQAWKKEQEMTKEFFRTLALCLLDDDQGLSRL